MYYVVPNVRISLTLLCLLTPTNMIVACDCDNRSNDKIYIIYLNSLYNLFPYCDTECAKVLRSRVAFPSVIESPVPRTHLWPHQKIQKARLKRDILPCLKRSFPLISATTPTRFKYLHRRLALRSLFLVS